MQTVGNQILYVNQVSGGEKSGDASKCCARLVVVYCMGTMIGIADYRTVGIYGFVSGTVELHDVDRGRVWLV